jgi:hypothetical protein
MTGALLTLDIYLHNTAEALWGESDLWREQHIGGWIILRQIGLGKRWTGSKGMRIRYL